MALLMRRAGAFTLYYLVIAPGLIVVVAAGVLLRALARDLDASLFAEPIFGDAIRFLVLTLPVGAYFAISEARPRGGTSGKRRLGLQVVTLDGSAPSAARSRARLQAGAVGARTRLIWRFASPRATEPILDAGLVLVCLLIAANLLSAIRDDERRTPYDRLSSTRSSRSDT